MYYVNGRSFTSYYGMKYGGEEYEPFAYIVKGKDSSIAKKAARDRISRERGNLVKIDSCYEMPMIQAPNADLSLSEIMWWESNLFSFDVETSGLSPKDDRITEIGISQYVNEERCFTNTRSMLINDGVILPDGGMKYRDGTPINDITNELLEGKPSFEEIVRNGDLNEILRRDVILISHNRGFDAAFLFESLNRIGWKGERPNFVCSMELSMQVDVGQPVNARTGNTIHKLEALKELFGIGKESQTHRAGDDAEDAGNIFRELAKRHVAFRNMTAEEMLSFFDRTE